MKATLRIIHHVRKWLTVLRYSTALPVETLRLNIQLEYRKLMENTHLDWPSGSSTFWLARSEELMNKAEQYEENLPIWLRDVCLMWEQVPDLIVYFINIKLNIRKYTTAEYTPAEISLSIYFHWEHLKQRSILKPVSKPKATRSAFAIQGVSSLGKTCQMSQSLQMSQKLEPLLLESQRPNQRKIRTEKIISTIEAAITPTKVARATKTQRTALVFQDLIVQQIDKNANPVTDAAVYPTISASAILH